MSSPDFRSTSSGWLQQCAVRLTVLWPVKLLGMTAGMTTFFIAYFQVLQHPRSSPVLMPLIAVDRWIGFWPAALPLYLSLWIYVSLPPALLETRRELVNYGTAMVILAALGLGLFFLWPTVVPQPDIDWSQYPSFGFLKRVDATGNACPSLHVAFALFTAASLARTLRQIGAGLWPRALNWLWCLGILYSTLATRQHVALDVLAGTVVGGAVALASTALPASDTARRIQP